MSSSIEFWSSVELGTFARGLVRELRALGWDVHHRFEVSEDAYRRAATSSARFRLRWSSYVSYARSLRRRIRHEPPPAAMIVCTNTFYAPEVALRAACGLGVPVVHWVFDLFPDVLAAGDKIQARGRLERWLGRLTRSIFDRATANVFLGEGLLAHARSRYGDIPNSTVIPVGADGEPFRASLPAPRPAPGPVRILYCGNLGRMHDTETVVACVRRGLPPGSTIEFRGHGAGFRALAAAVAATNTGDRVRFGDSLGESDWTIAMKAADVALVTMRRGAEGVVMPSKTYSAMVAGQAILAICPRLSELAETVRRYDAGWVIEPGDSAGLATVLSSLCARPEELLEKRLNAFRAGHANFSQEVVALRWSQLFKSIVSDQP